MSVKHLELIKNGPTHFIKINSLTGRVSLFADHPHYKLKDALDFKKTVFSVGSNLSVIPLKTKNMFILEETESNLNKIQHFIFAEEDISSKLTNLEFKSWFKKSIFEFFTKSITVAYVICYFFIFAFYLRLTTTTGQLEAYPHITGSLTLAFVVLYYVFWSSKTKSSYLKVCFNFEFIALVLYGTANTVSFLYNPPMQLLTMNGY